jgi:hypothetical protein
VYARLEMEPFDMKHVPFAMHLAIVDADGQALVATDFDQDPAVPEGLSEDIQWPVLGHFTTGEIQVIIPREGRYAVDLFHDGEPIGHAPLRVVQAAR